MRGRAIVNTRAPHQAAALDRLLAAQGAVPLPYPTLAIAPPASFEALDRGVRRLADGDFDWLLLTSPNAVQALAARLHMLGCRIPHAVRVAVIGESTARAARAQLGHAVALQPPTALAASLAEALLPHLPARCFLPQSARAEPLLARRLRAGGGTVWLADAYDTVCCAEGGIPLPERLAQGRVDGIAFTSASTVECFVQRLHREGGAAMWPTLAALPLACIGPKTAAALDAAGLPPLVATPISLEGLVATLAHYFQAQPGAGPAAGTGGP